MTTSELNQQFGIKDKVIFFEGKGNLPCVTIKHPKSECVVSLYGAHVLSFIPAASTELLWMSDASSFEQGKAVRGGIPVCFPWFGPHATDSQKPQHGFARLSMWNVQSTEELQDGSIKSVMSLNYNELTKSLWPYSFEAWLIVVVNDKLNISLQVKNTGNETFTYTDALHTYFNISDLDNVEAEGFAGASYYSGFGSEIFQQQQEMLRIENEENRRYVNHSNDCSILDNGYQRKINISKTGSNVTVVWNPHAETTKTIGDIPDESYSNFLCVEAANYYTDAVTLAPGEQHILSQTFYVA